MVFRSFYTRLAFRMLLLVLLLFALSYCIVQEFYLRSVYLAVFSILSGGELTYFIINFARKIEAVHESMLERDFSFRMDELGRHPFSKVYASLNRLAELYKTISTEKEIQHRYLETLVKHVSVGLISFRDDGSVFLVNDAFLKIIGRNSIKSIDELSTVSEELANKIRVLEGSRTDLVKIRRSSQLLNLALSTSEFKLDDRRYKLISLQDITSELSAGEMEAWQKLIRVLTHEIMNSISPIISLSSTLHELSKQRPSDDNKQAWETFHAGLEAIQNRGEGLRVFTQRYRELTHIPAPEFKRVNPQRLIHHIEGLLRPEIERLRIDFSSQCEEGEVLMDEKLMEHVLINIVKNAMEAVVQVTGPAIQLSGRRADGRFMVEVSDNGPGFDESDLDKAFVPFYTTKEQGSGIGLSLARQVVLMHKGEIKIGKSELGGALVQIMI